MNAVHALKAARDAGVRLGLDGVSLKLVSQIDLCSKK